MTIQLVNQIQLAERGLGVADRSADARFVPDARFSLRGASAKFLRSSAVQGLRLADRLDPQYA